MIHQHSQLALPSKYIQNPTTFVVLNLVFLCPHSLCSCHSGLLLIPGFCLAPSTSGALCLPSPLTKTLFLQISLMLTHFLNIFLNINLLFLILLCYFHSAITLLYNLLFYFLSDPHPFPSGILVSQGGISSVFLHLHPQYQGVCLAHIMYSLNIC